MYFRCRRHVSDHRLSLTLIFNFFKLIDKRCKLIIKYRFQVPTTLKLVDSAVMGEAKSIRQHIVDLLAIEPQTPQTIRQIEFLERDLVRVEQQGFYLICHLLNLCFNLGSCLVNCPTSAASWFCFKS